MQSVVPSTPMVFLKPSSALLHDGGCVLLPRMSSDVHHEVELVIQIGKSGKNIPEVSAPDYISGYAVGLDMTARDIQAKAKEKGHPWSVAKGFDTFAPLGDFRAVTLGVDVRDVRVRLEINGILRQDGRTSDMIFSPAVLVSFCSTIFSLEPGDLIYTGTPEGVGPVAEGDELYAEIDGLPPLRVTVDRDTASGPDL